MATFNINIDLDKRCLRCKKKGATDNGLCLDCINKAIKNGEYDHILKDGTDRLTQKMHDVVHGKPEQ